MKKFKFSVATVLLVALTVFASCSDDNDDHKPAVAKHVAPVTIVEGDSIAEVNEEITLDVTFTVDNLCGTFKKFEETPQTNGSTITVVAAYEDDVCGTAQASKTVEYKFQASAAGTYALKFKQSDSDFITHTVVVE